MNEQMARVNNILNDDRFCRLMKLIREKETDRIFCRHGLDHCLDVARIAYIISLESFMGIDKEIIYAAALLHDVGRADPEETGCSHNVLSVKIAGEIMEKCGFSNEEIHQVLDAIDAHNTDGDSRDGLAYVLYKADKISRNCFECSASDRCYWPEEEKNKELTY